MLKEYDFSKGVRGVHARRYAEGVEVIVDDQKPQTSKSSSDTQLTELAGRPLVISQMTRDGLEVAIPVRDRGVDLVAYSDIETSGKFVACPIQLKVHVGRRFGLDRKYKKIANLLMVYVWNVESATEQTVYAMTYTEAEELLVQKGYDKSLSWSEGGAYSVARPDNRLLDLLEPFRVKAGGWKKLVEKVLQADLPKSA